VRFGIISEFEECLTMQNLQVGLRLLGSPGFVVRRLITVVSHECFHILIILALLEKKCWLICVWMGVNWRVDFRRPSSPIRTQISTLVLCVDQKKYTIDCRRNCDIPYHSTVLSVSPLNSNQPSKLPQYCLEVGLRIE